MASEKLQAMPSIWLDQKQVSVKVARIIDYWLRQNKYNLPGETIWFKVVRGQRLLSGNVDFNEIVIKERNISDIYVFSCINLNL